MFTVPQPQLASTQSLNCATEDEERDRIARQIRFENKRKNSPVKTSKLTHKPPTPMPAAEILSQDLNSAQGQFGWTQFANNFFPYLTRSGEKYVALHMVEYKIFYGWKLFFSDEVPACYEGAVKQFRLTRSEAKLLNEINLKHCDNSFGHCIFTSKNTMIRVKDAIEINEFFYFCYMKLMLKSKIADKHGGFIRNSSENFMPYVWLDSKQYVPLFYLDGECKYLEDRSVELRGWELSYMKLLCKIQGIRKSFIGEESLRAVDLEIVKKCFAADTLFEEFWPTDVNTSSLLRESSPNGIENTKINNQQDNVPKKMIHDIVSVMPNVTRKALPLQTRTPSAAQHSPGTSEARLRKPEDSSRFSVLPPAGHLNVE